MTIATITPTGMDVDWQALILQEIANPAMKRAQVADTYSILIARKHLDWKAINAAIVTRWSKSGLAWIKGQAWKRLEGKQ